MKKLIVALVVAISSSGFSQVYDTNNVVVQTFAGSGFSGYLDGQGTQTMFDNPLAVLSDTSSNLFVLDSKNNRIRKIAPDAYVSTFAGGGVGGLPGFGTNVSLSLDSSGSMAIDHSNALWIVSGNSARLMRIGSDGYVSQSTNLPGLGYGYPSGVCVDSGNNIYYSTYSTSAGNRIYRLRTNGILEVFAGSGNQGSEDGNGIFTSFYNPAALASDTADNIYVWDSGNHLIRRINQNRDVVTIAGKISIGWDSDGVGTNAAFSSIRAMCVDNSGNLILADGVLGIGDGGSSIRKMSATTNVTTIAGNFGQTGYANGAGSLARFYYADGVCVSQGMIFIADSSNQRIRNITFNPAPQPVSGANLSLATYAGLSITGVVGRTYSIEASTDMSRWNPETTILLTGSPYLWIDQNSLGQQKFYRALLLP